MSQAQKLQAFAQAVGQDIKQLNQTAGRLASLQTGDKSSLTAAINDNAAGAATTYSGQKIEQKISQAIQTAAAQGAAAAKNDILGGSVAAELDTLREIAAELTQNKTAAAGIAQKLAEHKNSIDAVNSVLNTDLVAVYTRAKSA